MSTLPDDPAPDGPPSTDRPKLPSARDAARGLPAPAADPVRPAADRRGDRDRRRDRDRGRAGARRGVDPEGREPPAPPGPAPATSEPPPQPIEPDLGEAPFEADGRPWVARVLGRSGGTAAAAPLLLLGFTPAGDPVEASGLEAWVAGRTLRALSEADLESAFARAVRRSVPGAAGRG